MVPTPMQWPPQSQAPLSWLAGRHAVVANHQPLSRIPTHTPNTLRKPSKSSRSSLPRFRCDHKGEQPSSVRHIATWNVGGWTQPGRAGDDKFKAIKASLHKGPIVLQETHWTHEQATRLHTLIPGIHVVSTAATLKNTLVLRSLCQLGMRSSHTRLYYQDKS